MTPQERYQQYMDAAAIIVKLMESSKSRKVEECLFEARQKIATAFGSEMINDTAVKP